MKFSTRAWMILMLCISAYACAQEVQTAWTFKMGDGQYQAVFMERSERNTAWHQDLVLRRQAPGEQDWHVVQTIPGVHLEQAVKLQRNHCQKAFVISRPGRSGQLISVVVIDRKPAGMPAVLSDEPDRGGFDCRLDSKGRLIALRFHYSACEQAPDIGGAKGHVFTYRDLDWSASTKTFHRSPVRIDREAEQKASLASLLLAIGADECLGVKRTYRAKDQTATVIYEPQGILKDKTPPELRSARFVKAIITRSADNNQSGSVKSLTPWTSGARD